MIKRCYTCRHIIQNKCSATMHPFVDCIPGDDPLPYLLWEPNDELSDLDLSFGTKQHIKELEEHIHRSIKKAYDEGYDKGFSDGLNEKEQELT